MTRLSLAVVFITSGLIPFICAFRPPGRLATIQTIKDPDLIPAPGYFVEFVDPESYTIDAHINYNSLKGRMTVMPAPGHGYFSPDLSGDDLAAVTRDPGVAFLKANYRYRQKDSVESNSTRSKVVPRDQDRDASWNLAMISELTPRSGVHDNGPMTYHFTRDPGTGVDIYIMDSGVVNPITASGESLFINDVFEVAPGQVLPLTTPGGYHGTEVASIAAGRKTGVARGATIISAKTSTETGPMISALSQIKAAIRARRGRPNYKGSVVNISMNFEDGTGVALSDYIEAIAEMDVPVVVAAGNDGFDTDEEGAFIYPCHYTFVICVGMVGKDYKMHPKSNWGKNVALLGPGHEVHLIDDLGQATTNTGTSFAAPHVSGILATWMPFVGDRMTKAQAVAILQRNAAHGAILDRRPRTPDILANNGYLRSGSLDTHPYV